MRMKLASIVAALAMVVASTAQANVFSKPATTEAASVQRVSVPTQNQFRIGKKAPPKHQSLPQTSWICYTPAGNCQVPGLGFCCCTFWNGWSWVQYCGST
jgi:hypothetical protein